MGSELQAGIDRFSQEQGRDFYVFRLGNLLRLHAQEWVSGLMAFASDRGTSGKLQPLPYPVLNVSGNQEQPGFPSVLNDCIEMGARAAEHLIDCGAGAIQYFTFQRKPKGYRGQRREGCARVCQERGIPFHLHKVLGGRDWDLQRQMQLRTDSCVNWLNSQPLPLAVITENPIEAYYLALAARQLGVALGKDLALIQLSDPRESLRFSDPSISSIGNDWREVGYRAAEYLVKWVEEGVEPPAVTWIPPLRMMLTPSSDPSHSSDLCTRFRSHLLHSDDFGLQVTDVASALGVSETTLLREVKRVTSLTPKDHLIRRQLGEAKRLLRSTELTSEEVSRRCGYRVVHSLNAAFRKHEEMPPGQWRSLHADSLQ